ncbi:MAG: hypothetical protein COA33_002950 [Fluviicola sp.]|nr:hypothetical protein [Fluviicola sp.]
MKKLILIFFLSITSNLVFGQFSNDKEKFIKEFQKALAEYGKGEYQEFAKKKLPVLLLESNTFSTAHFSKLVETCNFMLTKKLKPYPEVYNYVFSMSSLLESKQSDESYTAWHNSVDKLLSSRNPKKFKAFIEMSAGFFSERRIASSSNFNWYYIGGEYEFVYNKKAFIKFSSGNLVCRVYSKRSKDRGAVLDSLNVIATSGTYDPNLKKWIGDGGTITWEKVGLDKNKTFAKINSYDLSLRNSTLRIDSVTLTTPYFEQAIEGSLTERAFKINREVDKVYPQFLSFERKLIIENVVENVDYIGGFALKGSNFIGAGTNSQPAKITYIKNEIPFMTALSKEIVISKKKIAINKAVFKLFLASGDSITHPGINFLYDFKKKEIQLSRTGGGIAQAPFQDSYHKLDIYVPKIIWKEDSDNLFFTYEFGTSQEQKIARFESQNLFDEEVYDRLQGLATVHPLVEISRYCYKYDEYSISEGAAATALHMEIGQAKSTLLTLSNMGFISYDTEAKWIIVNKKLQTFVDAKAGTKDYDNIVFKADLRPKKLRGYTDKQIEEDAYLQSLRVLFEKQNEERRLKKNFGVMNLTTFDLDLEAIDNIIISKSKNTMIFPKNSTVKVKQNRDFNFSGWINSGKLEVNTELANFSYDDYKFKLLKTSESLFRVRPMNKQDGPRPIAMVSALSGLTGEILVDDPGNRSGKSRDFDHYPKLKVTNSSKIFYNSKSIYRGAYDSTRFYYTVLPFEMDSLNSFEERAMRLEGELVSAGIFPKIKEPLKIMADYSFGFSTEAPSGGLDFYGPDATYDNKIVLSNNGLQGSGTINFVHSTSVSKALTFLPDSTVGIAQFENKPIESGVQFPDVTAKDAYITYLPKSKVLRAKSTPKNEMLFFDGEARLRGTAIVKPSGMTGNGLMTFVSATLVSDNFQYKRYDVDADTAGFSLRNDSEDLSENALAFKTDNVKANVSFKERKGEFKSNEGESVVEFPVNQYMCKMDMFTWLMDELSIEMQKTADKQIAINSGVDLVGPNFFSTHPKQDSLQFRAPKAKFDLREKTIYCEKVEYVDIADARIYPDSMKLQIRKKAKIDKLLNARIVANYITKYHSFEKAEVQIKARRDYEASGQYPYYDIDSNVTYIAMNDIGLDTSYQTRASGEIAQEVKFKLSKEFDYYGDVAIRAENPLISFSGATRINHDCNKFDKNWMAFTSEIDPKNIQIPVSSEMKDLEGNPISAGIVWRDSPATDSIKLYPTFLSSLVSKDDPIAITASGVLQYNARANQFEIGSKEKLNNQNEPGNYLALHTESCSLNGMGVIDLGMDYGDLVVDAVGVVNYDQTSGKTSMNVTARFDMAMDKGLLTEVAKRINEVDGLKAMSFNSTTLEQAVVEWDGQKEADKFKDEYVREGKAKKLPKSLQKTITITGLRLSSYDNNKSQDKGLITNVDAAVLVSMYNEPVMKFIPYKAFFQQIYSKSGGDKFAMYINIPGGRDYFFDYSMQKKDGTLRIKTGDQEFSSKLTEMKDEKRKKKNFKYEATSSSVFMAKFLNHFE